MGTDVQWTVPKVASEATSSVLMPRSMLAQLKCVGEFGVKNCRLLGLPRNEKVHAAVAPMLWPECDMVVPSGEVHSRSMSRN